MIAHLPFRRPLLIAVAAFLALAPGARASETQWWIADTPADYAKADARGVVVRPDGSLEAGPETRRWAADSLNVVWALAALPDGGMALGGDRGRIERWTEQGGVRPWVKLPVGQVLSLAWSDGALYAGTGPEGLVYRITANGDTTLVARTGERYVWALVPGPKGVWWVATGTRGRLLRIEGGKVRVALDTDESNLACAIADGRGGVYAGGDSKGRVFHAGADGSLSTVLDASEDEVRALALGADGALYAAALSGSAVAADEDESTTQPAPVKAAVTGGRAVVYRVVPDSVSQAWWTSPQPFVFALAATSGGVVAATGNRAGLYRLERPQGASQWLASGEGQVTALLGGGDGRVFAASSNPAALWRLGPGRASSGEIVSAPLDARRIAAFGRLRWSGAARGAKVRLFARSGNTDTPDTTWSAWRGGEADEDGVRPGVPAARFLQWKLALEGGEPKVGTVMASWRERNLPPRIDDLQIAPQGASFREGELTPRMESVTQTLPGGQKVEYNMPAAPTAKALRELPMWARGLRTLQWKGSDPNGDALTYRVDVRGEPDGAWIEVGKDLDGTSFTWDTNALADGLYRIRVTASDQAANAIGEEARDSSFTEPFTVDNTPPVFAAFAARGEGGAIAIEGRVEDATSPLSRIEASVDDGDWRIVSPEGGLADARSASFRARFPGVAPGEHHVAVRGVDLAGNPVLRALRVTVARSR